MTMKPRDIKRLEKCVAYYGMILDLLDKCAKSASDNEFVQDVIGQVKVYTKTDKVYLEGTLKRIKENKE